MKEVSSISDIQDLCQLSYTVFPQFSAPGHLPIFEVFGGALIKAYENLDSPFPAHSRTLFIIYNN